MRTTPRLRARAPCAACLQATRYLPLFLQQRFATRRSLHYYRASHMPARASPSPSRHRARAYALRNNTNAPHGAFHISPPRPVARACATPRITLRCRRSHGSCLTALLPENSARGKTTTQATTRGAAAPHAGGNSPCWYPNAALYFRLWFGPTFWHATLAWRR